MTPACLVGVDWGTTSARAYLFAHDGSVLDHAAGPWGVSRLPGVGDRAGAFTTALSALTGAWASRADVTLPVLASGMVGSVSGWREVPYRTLPAPLLPEHSDLATVTGVHGEPVHLIPGLRAPGNAAEGTMVGVMRGEETELVGAAVGPDELAVLPGTHSKWVRLTAGGDVASFTTYLTGELHDLLLNHSTLAAPRVSAPAWTAYDDGVRLAQEQADRGALATLFTARARAVTGTLAAAEVGDYLSGLLIGGELVASEAFRQREPLALIGSPTLTMRYARAASALGWTDLRTVTDAAPQGLWRTAVHLGLVPGHHPTRPDPNGAP